MTAGGPAQRLFLVVLGGRIDGCHIEQHDVRFVAGASIDDTIPQLREQWFGRRRGLHIDSWVVVEAVAGWRVELRPEPFEGPQRLWFVNGGGYQPGKWRNGTNSPCWWPPPPRRQGPGASGRC
jgi:hypothetical protein